MLSLRIFLLLRLLLLLILRVFCALEKITWLFLSELAVLSHLCGKKITFPGSLYHSTNHTSTTFNPLFDLAPSLLRIFLIYFDTQTSITNFIAASRYLRVLDLSHQIDVTKSVQKWILHQEFTPACSYPSAKLSPSGSSGKNRHFCSSIFPLLSAYPLPVFGWPAEYGLKDGDSFAHRTQ